MKRDITERDLVTLRQRGLILSEETAFWVGDDLIVENVLTKQQRVLGQVAGLVLESQKRVLKG